MTKIELKKRKAFLTEELNKVNAELERYEAALTLKDKAAPFKKWSIAEINDLFNISEAAYDFLYQNQELSILDYNATQTKSNRILLEK